MDDAIHVKIPFHRLAFPTLLSRGTNVQIVELVSVGVWPSHADRYLLSIHFSRLLFDDLRDDLRVLLREPAEKCWNTHVCFCFETSGPPKVVRRNYTIDY